MKRSWIAGVLAASLVTNGTAWAQGQSTTKARSGTLVAVGGLTMVAGMVTALPHGETYRVLGDEYCVQEYSVDYGGCSNSRAAKVIGVSMLGAGLAMVLIGSQQVTVSPQVSRTSVGAAATIGWGRFSGRR